MASDQAPAYQVPLRATIWKKKLTATEKLILLAMLEHNSSGDFVWASLQRIADETALGRTTVQRALHDQPARVDKQGRTRSPRIGLITRRVVAEVAPPSTGRRRPATYRINLDAAQDDPRMRKYFERAIQPTLQFPADEIDLQKWITHNKSLWASIIEQIRAHATTMVGRPASDPDRIRAARNIAFTAGMPIKLAELVFSDSTWKRDRAHNARADAAARSSANA